MARDYIVYPEAERKLESSGLIGRINAVKEYDENFPSIKYLATLKV